MDPCDICLKLFKSDDDLTVALKDYIVSELRDGDIQQLLNREAIIPTPPDIKDSKEEIAWQEEHWGTASDLYYCYANKFCLEFATSDCPPLKLFRRLAVLTGYDLQFCWGTCPCGPFGEGFAFADSYLGWQTYDSLEEAPQFLLGQAGIELTEDVALALEKPIPRGWGRALTPLERLRAVELFDVDDTNKLFVRRSVPDLSGEKHGRQMGRLYTVMPCSMKIIGCAQC